MPKGTTITCETVASGRKLAGAAKASFVKKCEADGPNGVSLTCETKAVDKKLAGAARKSFVKKCEADGGKS